MKLERAISSEKKLSFFETVDCFFFILILEYKFSLIIIKWTYKNKISLKLILCCWRVAKEMSCEPATSNHNPASMSKKENSASVSA